MRRSGLKARAVSVKRTWRSRIRCFILEIAFLIDGHVRLHGGNAQGLRRWRGAKELPDAIAKDERDEGDGQVEIIVRPELVAPDLHFQTLRRDHDHHVHHHDEEGETAHAGDVAHLDESDVLMESDSETVPAESGEDDAAQPFKGRPSGRGERGDEQVVPGFQPDRSGFRRRLARFGHRAYEERPEGRIDAEIKTECDPARDRDGDQPM